MKSKGFAPFFFILVLMNTFLPFSAQAQSPQSSDPTETIQRSFDYFIKDAIVFDGVSWEGRKVDVGISKDRISFVGKLDNPHSPWIIESKGLVLTPGFIDAHTHSDFNPLVYPGLANKVSQGVTTEVVGNCGMSAAPLLGSHAKRVRTIWAREGVQIPEKILWNTFKEYREVLEEKGMITNFVGLVGHGNLRSAVMGMDPRPSSPSEMEQMKHLLSQAMKEGAYGISFGLVYLPGVYAQQNEIIDLCQEAARHLGVCAFHMRSEGTGLIDSIREVIHVAEVTKARVQISHLKAGGKGNWAKIDYALKLIEQARLRGLKITADAYPYNAGYAELGAVLPSELYERNDRNQYFRNLLKRGELVATMRAYDEKKYFNWDSVVIASTASPRYQPYEGMTLKQAARKMELEPIKFLIGILADTQFEVSAFYFSQNEDVIQKVMVEPYVAGGSDSIADGTRKPHPRTYGTFPKIFRQFMREKKVLELGEVIRKLTSLPADQFGLKDRGRIEEGAYADLVLFDAGEITDRATYSEAKKESAGIRWVFVNGQPALKDGKLLPGKNGVFLQNR